MDTNFQQNNFNDAKVGPHWQAKKGLKRVLFFLALIAVGFLLFALGQNSNTVSVENRPWWRKIGGILSSTLTVGSDKTELLNKEFPVPEKESDRWDILVLGIRGAGDVENGGLLTDSITLSSLNKTTGQTSLVSIPRDIFVDMPTMISGKVNEIYEKGLAKKDGLGFSKEAFSRITGVHIDNIIVFDFQAFKEIVDTVGGVDIKLEKPFDEAKQWGYPFHLDAGPNHLDGQNALYYARSRFSSSDFDRSLRQQKIILAIKNKALSLGILANPLKITSLLGSLRKNISTDLNIWDSRNILKLAATFSSSSSQSKTATSHLSTDNILDQTIKNNLYILLPKNNDWSVLRKFFSDALK